MANNPTPNDAAPAPEAQRKSLFKVPEGATAENLFAELEAEEHLAAALEAQAQSEGSENRFSANRFRQSSPEARMSSDMRQSAMAGVKRKLTPVGPGGLIPTERALVGALLADNSLYDLLLQNVTGEDFSDGATKAVFAVIQSILEGKVEGISVAEPMTVSVRPGMSKVIGLQKLQGWATEADTDPAKVASRAQVVHEAAVSRRMGIAVSQAQDILVQDLSVHEKAAELSRVMQTGAEELQRSDTKSAGDFAIQAVEELAEFAKLGKDITGITTGFRDLDALLAGLHPGQLIIIGARPAVGKTALALSMMLAMAKAGVPGLMVSLEMLGAELAKRALAQLSDVDSQKIRIAALNELEWEKVIAAAEELKTLPLQFNDELQIDLPALRAMARRRHKEGNLKVLVIDYLQIMKGNPKLSREQQISEISRGLKLIAMELKIPVIALSQLNREVDKRVNKRPMLSDLRESGAIEQDADVIMFVHRDDVNDANAPAQGRAEIIVAKQRAGRLGDVLVTFDKPATRFQDLAGPKAAAPLLVTPSPERRFSAP